MKRIKLSLFIALIAVLGISCSEKETGNEIPKGEGELTYFSFNLALQTPSADTRTETYEVGSNDENEVFNVSILLFDPVSQILLYRFDLDAAGGAGSNFSGNDVVTGNHATNPTSSRFVSVARQVIKQDYGMVVYANSQNSPIPINDFVVGLSTLQQVNTAVGNLNASDLTVNGFFMSNANGVVPIAASQLRDNAQDAESNPVSVRIDRIVAKVGVSKKFPDSYTVNGERIVNDKGAIIKNVRYGIDVTNRISYPIRQYAEFAGQNAGNNESYAGQMETYATSINANRKWMYATDPNFAFYFPHQFNYLVLSSESGPVSTLYPLPDRTDGPDYQYVLENTMSLVAQSADNYLDYTTSVLISANIFPEDITEDTGYYSFTNTLGEPKVFTHEDASQWYNTGTYPAEMEGLKELLESPSCEFVFTFPASPEPTAFMTSNGVTFHYDGINIYRIPVKHFNATGSPIVSDPRKEVYGYLGVVRNNIYSVVITAIDGPGVGAYSYISADINVNEWYVRPDQEEGI